MDYKLIILSISIIFGFFSAGAWFYSSQVKVTREKAVKIAKKKAQKKNEQPNLSGVSFDGWDVREILKAQSKWQLHRIRDGLTTAYAYLTSSSKK
ncbi:hypothetical protein [Acinetobacter nosocomialis]|uniref:hypothetical protein n=1 Tax=Acinetobacter nosocomialis TaxID=106654 RepID=UPI002FEF7F34